MVEETVLNRVVDVRPRTRNFRFKVQTGLA